MRGLVRNLWSFLMSLCPKVVISQYSSTKPVTSLLPSLPQRALLRLISQHLKRAWLSKWPAAVSEETQALKARDTGPSSSSHATFDCKGETICTVSKANMISSPGGLLWKRNICLTMLTAQEIPGVVRVLLSYLYHPVPFPSHISCSFSHSYQLIVTL